MKPALSTVFYAPGDWLSGAFTARQRRAAAAWVMILILFPGTPIMWPWKDVLVLTWALSVVSLVLAMAGVVSAETPVEAEDVNVEQASEVRGETVNVEAA